MSVVTDIILTTFLYDGAKCTESTPNADRLSDYLVKEHDSTLVKVDRHAGGNKRMQCDVFMAAINHLDVEKFISFFQTIKWEDPDMVQLLIKEEDDDIFSIHVPLN